MDFYLYIASAGMLSDAMARLTHKGSVSHWTRKLNPFGVFTYTGMGNAMIVEAQDVMEFNNFRRTLMQVFQIDPTIKFRFIVDEFHYDKSGNYAGVTSTLRAASALLEDLAGDVVLLSAQNEVVLQRKSGKLLLNTEWGFWNPFRISQISIPYQLDALPPPPWS